MTYMSPVVEGINLPVNIIVGDVGSSTTPNQGTGTVVGNEALIQGAVKINNEALGEQAVTVPAGTLTAMKVKTEITVEARVTLQGNSIPISSKFNMTLWRAPQGGLIRTETAVR